MRNLEKRDNPHIIVAIGNEPETNLKYYYKSKNKRLEVILDLLELRKLLSRKDCNSIKIIIGQLML